jgi:hypothetical protein
MQILYPMSLNWLSPQAPPLRFTQHTTHNKPLNSKPTRWDVPEEQGRGERGEGEGSRCWTRNGASRANQTYDQKHLRAAHKHKAPLRTGAAGARARPARRFRLPAIRDYLVKTHGGLAGGRLQDVRPGARPGARPARGAASSCQQTQREKCTRINYRPTYCRRIPARSMLAKRPALCAVVWPPELR